MAADDIEVIENRLVRLLLRGEQIPIERFITALQEMMSILREVDLVVSEGRASARWNVSDLRSGSAIVEATPILARDDSPDNSRIIIAAFVQGMRLINQTPHRPRYFNDDALISAKKLSNLLGEGIDKVSIAGSENGTIEPVVITQRLAANVDELIGVRDVFEGSVEGTLEVLSIHGGVSFNIYDVITSRRVVCHCTKETLKQLSDHLGRRILAQGEVRSNAQGQPLSIRADNVRVLRERKDLPQPDDIKHILEGEPIDSEEFGDYLRGEGDVS